MSWNVTTRPRDNGLGMTLDACGEAPFPVDLARRLDRSATPNIPCRPHGVHTGIRDERSTQQVLAFLWLYADELEICMRATPPSTADSMLGPRPVLDLALNQAERGSTDQALALVDALSDLARQDAALTMRLAMVLTTVRTMDISALGFTSFSAFLTERVGLGASWVRGLIALISSPLDLIKRATASGLIPLRRAVKAPGQVSVDGQIAWLQQQAEPQISAEPAFLEVVEGDHADTICEARRLARIVLGKRAHNAEIDAWLIDVFQRRVPLDALLAQARERPPKPPEPEPLDWAWCRQAPAASLLGPWSPPADLADALAQIAAILTVKNGRDAVLARAWAITDHLGLWQLAGFDSRWDFAQQVFGWSKRTAQRRSRVGWALEWYPELDAAVRNGLGLGAAALLSTVIDGDSCPRWLAVAQRVGRGELARGLQAARTGIPRQVLAQYEHAIAQADQWVSEEPTSRAPTAGGRLKVALAVSDPTSRTPGYTPVRATSAVLEAAQWWVAHVVLPKGRGFQAVKDRDGHRCQNPECGKSTLRVEAHHIHHREHGGADTLENGLTSCRPCHLRGLHAGGAISRIRAAAVTVAHHPAILWRYADGRRVLQFR